MSSPLRQQCELSEFYGDLLFPGLLRCGSQTILSIKH
jgi:hypothetical protein